MCFSFLKLYLNSQPLNEQTIKNVSAWMKFSFRECVCTRYSKDYTTRKCALKIFSIILECYKSHAVVMVFKSMQVTTFHTSLFTTVPTQTYCCYIIKTVRSLLLDAL